MLKLRVGGTGRTDVDIKSIQAAGKGRENQEDGVVPRETDNPRVTLCMIVKDEEEHIGRCLASLKGHVDEIVVVDTGSTDKTIEICKSYGAKVYEHPWENSFSIARNQAMAHVETEWIIQLDADEEMDAESAPKIRDIVRSAHTSTSNLCHLILINRQLGSTEELSIINTGKIIRMGVGAHYENRIHNKLVCGGDTRLTSLKIYHYGYHLEKEVLKKKYERTTSMLLAQEKDMPEDRDTQFYLAVQYLRNEEWDKCIEYSERGVRFYLRDEPNSQLILLTYHAGATAWYHKKSPNLDVKKEYLAKSADLCLKALAIYPDYLDANCLLSSIQFALKEYDKCYTTSIKYLSIVAMLKADMSKSLVIPMNTLKNEWLVNTHLAINFYEQADKEKAIMFLGRAEACCTAESRYKPSFVMFKYMIQRGDPISLKNVEIIYKEGFRAE